MVIAMDNIEKITESLEKEAKEKKEEIIAEAKEKAEEKKSEAREKAEDISGDIIEEGKREAKAMEKRILSSAKTEARRKKLGFKDEMSKKVFEEVDKRLKELKDDREGYQETTKNLIIDGGIAVNGGDLEVLLPTGESFLSEEEIDELEEKIESETGKETSLDVLEELEKSKGGAIVRKSDRTLQCNNTFEARLERMKNSLRTKVIDELFETKE